MGTMPAPAVRAKGIEIPRKITTGLRVLDRFLNSYESPLTQLAVIILAAAMASVLGAALIKLVAGSLGQS